MSVRLTNREMAMGAECGIMRNIAAMADDRCDQYGFAEEFGWNAHIEGACGEVAAGKIMGRFWSPTVNTFAAPDIGRHIQVRTRSRHDTICRSVQRTSRSIIRARNRQGARFMVRGYISPRMHDVMNGGRSRRAAIGGFVPQRAVMSIHD